MDLEGFIKQTIRGIAGATATLQEELEGKGVIVNPPADRNLDLGTVNLDAKEAHLIRVQSVEFDVAVTASSEGAVNGGVKVKVIAFEVGADAKHGRSAEQVNRVRFSIPLALPPSKAGENNREEYEKSSGPVKRNLKSTV